MHYGTPPNGAVPGALPGGSSSGPASAVATGQAEAEAMNKRAEAFKNYNDAAVLQMLVEILPQMAEKVAAPMGSIDKLTVVSTDGAGQLPKQVTDTLTQTLQMVSDTTGFDLQALLKRVGNQGGGSAPTLSGTVE